MKFGLVLIISLFAQMAFTQDRGLDHQKLVELSVPEMVALAKNLSKDGRQADAEYVIRKALSFEETNDEALTELGIVLLKRANIKNALVALEKAIEYGATDGRAELALAMYSSTNSKDKYFEASLEKQVEFAYAYRWKIEKELLDFQSRWFEQEDSKGALQHLDLAFQAAKRCVQYCKGEKVAGWPNTLLRLKRFYLAKSDGRPYRFEGDSEAEIIWIPTPKSNPRIYRLHSKSSARVILKLGTDGRISGFGQLNKYLQRYDKELEDALLKTVFIPKIKNGKPVSSKAVVRVPFHYGFWARPVHPLFKVRTPFE